MPRSVELMRQLIDVVRAERGAVGVALAKDVLEVYRYDGVGVPIINLCDFIIEDSVPLPRGVVDLYRDVGETEMSWDPEFMDDYFRYLERLIA